MVLMLLVWAGIAAIVSWQVRILRRERGLEREHQQRGSSAVTATLHEDVSAVDEDLWRLGRDPGRCDNRSPGRSAIRDGLCAVAAGRTAHPRAAAALLLQSAAWAVHRRRQMAPCAGRTGRRPGLRGPRASDRRGRGARQPPCVDWLDTRAVLGATVAFYAYATGYFNGDWAGSRGGALAALNAGIVGPFAGIDGGRVSTADHRNGR